MNDTQSQPPAAWRAELDALRNDLGQLRREVIQDSTTTEQLAETAELRITALEEVLAVRWPARILARWRLARDLRASVAHVQGGTFGERRIEAIGTGWAGPVRQQPPTGGGQK